MHDSLQNDVKDGEVSCDCLHENVCINLISNFINIHNIT